MDELGYVGNEFYVAVTRGNIQLASKNSLKGFVLMSIVYLKFHIDIYSVRNKNRCFKETI